MWSNTIVYFRTVCHGFEEEKKREKIGLFRFNI